MLGSLHGGAGADRQGIRVNRHVIQDGRVPSKDAVLERNIRLVRDVDARITRQRLCAVVERDGRGGVRAERQLRGIDRRAVRHHKRSSGNRGLRRARYVERQRSRADLFERTSRGRTDGGCDICGY